MNIEEFVNDYLKEHRHDVLLCPYIALVEFANSFKKKMMENALHGWLDEDNEPPYDLNVVCEEKIPFGKFKHGDKIRIIVVKEEDK